MVASLAFALWWVADDNADLRRQNGLLDGQRLAAVQTANDNADKIKVLAASSLAAAKSAAAESARAIEAAERYANPRSEGGS